MVMVNIFVHYSRETMYVSFEYFTCNFKQVNFHRGIFLHHSRENVYRTKLLIKNGACKSFVHYSRETMYKSFEYFSCNCKQISFHRIIFLHHSRENVYRTELLIKNGACKSFVHYSRETMYKSFEYFSCNCKQISFHRIIFLHHSRENVYRIVSRMLLNYQS